MLNWTWSDGTSKGQEGCRLDLMVRFQTHQGKHFELRDLHTQHYIENFEYNNFIDYQTTDSSFLRRETPNSGDADQLRK